MKLPWPRLLLAILLSGASAVGAEHTWTPARDAYPQMNLSSLIPPTVENSELRVRVGDEPRWSEPAWDDAAWEVASLRRVPADRGLVWLRLRVRDQVAPLPDALFLTLPYSYEFYWDGVLIGRSGRAASTRAEEVPANGLNILSVPPNLTARGEHVIAIRASGFHNRYPSPTAPVQILPMPLTAWRLFNSRSGILPHMAMGAMLMVAITALIMWLLAARMPALLAFVALTLCTTMAQAIAMAYWDYGYSYEWNYWANLARGFAIDAAGLCLVALVIVLFNLPRRSWLALLVLPLLGAALGWFGPFSNRPMLTSAFGLSLLGAGWAIWRQRLGARVVFAGLLITMTIWLYDPAHFVLAWYFQGFLPTLVGVTTAIALQVRVARQRAQDVRLTAARMELELLRKNLQPHFLMNSLAVIAEIVEQDPPRAVKLIEDLAHEFRSLARMSGERLIPLGQELELCRAHLRVMSVRTNQTWTLDAVDLDASASVPPAVFLTLIENGFSHQQVSTKAAAFSLRADRAASGANRYIFVSPGKIQTHGRIVPGGTGLRYVKARLEESFAGRWSLQSEPVPEGWRTTIEIAGQGAAS